MRNLLRSDASASAGPAPVGATLRVAHLAETERLLHPRLELGVAIFLLAMGAGTFLETVNYPDRASAATLVDTGYLVTALLGLIACRVGWEQLRPAFVAPLLTAMFALGMCWYHASVGAHAERLAMALVVLMTGFCVLLPWGWQSQLVLVLAVLAGFVLAQPHLHWTESLAYSDLVLAAGGAMTVCGAFYLARYRFDAFDRTVLLTDAAADKAAVLEAALDAIVTMDQEGRIAEWNRAAERMFGHTRQEVMGRDMAELIIPPGMHEQHRRGVRHYLATGQGPLLGRRIETTARRADGTEFPVEVAIARIRRDGPAVFTGYLRDITDRKRAEDALASSKRQTEEEAEIAAALVRVGETLGANLRQPDMLAHVSRVAAEALACDWSITLLRDEHRKAFRLCASAGASAEVVDELGQIDFTTQSLPVIRALRAGELLEIQDAASQTHFPPELFARWGVAAALCAPIAHRGEVTAVMIHGYRSSSARFLPKQRRLALGIAHATAIALENVRLITDLQGANRLKSEFVSTMSHELRTPLNVILGFCEMALDARLPPVERDDCVKRVDASARDLLGLIQSTLEIGRLEAKGPDVRLEAIALPVLWADLGAGCATLPRKADVRLDWNADVPDVILVTDPGKLSIVMRNLVGNALKFTEQGQVRARARVTADAVVLDVVDTGIGIGADDQQVIFEMFRQADGSDSRRYGGVGLGLYIVRQIVEQLGGSVAVESAPGRGSVFTVTFPRSSGTPAVRAA